MELNSSQDQKLCKILVFITFLYRKDRISTLFHVLNGLGDIVCQTLDVRIFTETEDADQIGVLTRLTQKFKPPLSIEIVSCPDAKLNLRTLPWQHKPFLKAAFTKENSPYTHFVYLEEDLRFSNLNFSYWLKYRRELIGHGLIPSFARVEFNYKEGDVFLSDIPYKQSRNRPKIRIDELYFLCVDEPYTGMHVLDRELVLEYVETPSFDISRSKERMNWGDLERAAMAMTFEAPPSGFRFRIALPVHFETLVPPVMTWIHHLPNNYTNDYRDRPEYILGKIRVDELFLPE